MTQRHRILVIDNSVATTGAYRSALAMARALRDDADIQFVLPAAPALHSEFASLGFRSHVLPMVEISRSVHRLLAYVPMLVLNGLRLRRLLGRERVDVLVANDYYNLLPTMVRLLGWRGRILTIVRLLPAAQQPWLNRVWIAAMRFASDRVIAVSNAVATQLPDHTRAEVLYFPVGRGLESIPYTPPPALAAESSVTFLYLANYIHGKGQGHALRAFAEVLQTFPSCRLCFVGGDMGLEKNAAYREALLVEAERHGLLGSVAFEGQVDNIAAVIHAADVVLNFSESESFSHTCVEAGLLGRPVIATRCGGPEEIVEDGTTGLLVPCAAVDEMANAMLRLVRNPSLRQEMARAAWSHTRERFGEAGFAATMARLIAD